MFATHLSCLQARLVIGSGVQNVWMVCDMVDHGSCLKHVRIMLQRLGHGWQSFATRHFVKHIESHVATCLSHV